MSMNAIIAYLILPHGEYILCGKHPKMVESLLIVFTLLEVKQHHIVSTPTY